MNNQIYVKGKGCISAKIIADSISFNTNKRITTFEIEYPRFILAELSMHRNFSKSSSSSRAIKTESMLEQIKNNPAMPIHWGKNQSGMQAENENDQEIEIELKNETILLDKITTWKLASVQAVHLAEDFANAGYHKQIVNRLVEPYQIMKTIVTATEYDNFFYLRCHKDAQPEIQELANCMYQAYKTSDSQMLYNYEWHLPFIENYRDENDVLHYGNIETELTLEHAKMISASCCAQTSYRKNDDTYEKALKIYDKLITSKPPHSGPFEHQATPIFEIRKGWLNGITHVDRKGNYWSGNFQGWIQFRQLIPNNTCWNYEETLDNQID